MKATQILHDAGQSLWLDNITRGLVKSGGLKRYAEEFSITGLTSNPSIFDLAIRNSADYDADIRQKMAAGKEPEPLFFELAIDDLSRAADRSSMASSKNSGSGSFPAAIFCRISAS